MGKGVHMHASFCVGISHNCNTLPHGAIQSYVQNWGVSLETMFNAKMILEFYVTRERKLLKTTEDQNQRGIIPSA